MSPQPQPHPPLPFGTLSLFPPELRYQIYNHLIPSTPFPYNILTPSQSPLPLLNLICTNHHFRSEIATNIAPSHLALLKQKIKAGEEEVEYTLDLRTSNFSFEEIDTIVEMFLRKVRRVRKRYQRELKGRLVFYPSVQKTDTEMQQGREAQMLREVCEEATVIENLGLELQVEEVRIVFEEEEDLGVGVELNQNQNQFLVLSAPVLRSKERVGERQLECGSSQGGGKEGKFLVLTADLLPRETISVRDYSARIQEKVVEWRKICQSRELINGHPFSGTLAHLVHPNEFELENGSDDGESAIVAGEEDWLQPVDWDQPGPEFDWPGWQLWVDDSLEFPVVCSD